MVLGQVKLTVVFGRCQNAKMAQPPRRQLARTPMQEDACAYFHCLSCCLYSLLPSLSRSPTIPNLSHLAHGSQWLTWKSWTI